MKLVLCEGGDDLIVMQCLCRAREIAQFKIEPFLGKDNFNNVLRALPTRPEFSRGEVESLAIILDADSDNAASWQKVRDAVQKSFQVHLTEPGVFAGRTPRIAGFIVGGPDGSGMLEDLCLHSVSDKPGYECLLSYFSCLSEKTGTKKYHSKGRFRAWMASQDEYELHVGLAATRGHLPFEHAAFDSLVRFLASI